MISRSLKEVFDCANKKPVAFLIKGSPDPDSIASSLALLGYYQSIGGEGNIYHEDYISHSANKAMINILDIKLNEIKLHEIQEPFYVLVDYNSPFIDKLDPTRCILHIDHHKENRETEGEEKAKYPSLSQVIEHDVGACSSIVTRLLDSENFFSSGALNIQQITTALVYGIKSDTDNLDNARSKDYEAMRLLSQYCDKDSLKQISKTRLSSQTAEILKRALQSEKTEQSWLYAGVGFLQETYRDSIAAVADEMMRRAGFDHVLVYAIIEKEGSVVVEGSVRSIDPGFDIDGFVKNFSNNAGGRKYKGGFQIPVGFWSSCPNQELLEEIVTTTIESRLKLILGTNKKQAKGKKDE